MAAKTWGHCQHCKHFGSPARIPLANEEAPCKQPELSRYTLIVFGASGCDAFEMRATAAAEASEAAPTAQ
jgi:hypothetical protein